MATTFVARAKPYRATLPHNQAVCTRCGIHFRHGRRNPTYCIDCRAVERLNQKEEYDHH